MVPSSRGGVPSPCQSATAREPILAIDEIQGNILLGFNKDFEALLFFEIIDATHFQTWLQDLARYITTTRDVLLFRYNLRELRSRGAERMIRTTWLQIAFSFGGLEKLVSPGEVDKFRDEAFRQGLAARSEAVLGDPKGAAQNWIVGGPHNEAHVVILVATDDARDLETEIERLVTSATSNGAQLLFCQRGARLPQRDREHFGFRDGISQPGIRGRISENPRELLTPRENPDDPNEGKPGQTLIWPGEFVFGYSGQDSTAQPGGEVLRAGPNSLGEENDPLAPGWAQNGSYLVFRRLRQYVGAFRRFIREESARLIITTDVLEAQVLGRFQSGAPIARTPVDAPGLAADDCANNDFRFAIASPAINPRVDNCQCIRSAPPASKDSEGLRCPFAAHIRKAYPRDDIVRFGAGLGREDTESHRILRRGIPFGPPYPELEPEDFNDTEERGLLFLAYQTSIVEQFEHIQSAWANEVEQSRIPPKGYDFSAGHDLIIGQSPEGYRQFLLRLPDGNGEVRIEILKAEPFVIPTGGGYFFVPSLTALAQIARDEL